MQTNRPDFSLDAVASLRNLGVTSDGAAVGGWFQINTDNPGQLGFSLSVDKAAHTIVLPAGLELGGYTLGTDFVFYTDAAGHITTEEAPEDTDPTEPETTEPETTEPHSYDFTITGVASGTYRSANSDWYIILNTDNSYFELEAPTGWIAPLAEGGAQVWFQSNAAMGQSGGKLIFTLTAGKDEHSVTIPAGLALGNYTVKEDFTFYTHRSGAVDTVRPTVLKGWSMTLGDNLDLNFFVSVNESEIANTRVQISVADETLLLDPETLDQETGNYIFSAELAAAQMTETVTFTLLVGNSVIETNTYTVRQYADYILTQDQFDETTKNLVRAMLVYGAKAQSYFACNTDTYADAGMEYQLAAVPAEIAPPILTGAVDGLQYYGSSMLFTSKNAVRYYFVLSDGANIADYTFTAGNKVLTAKAKDSMYFVDVAEINPQDLDKPMEVTVTCGERVLTVGYSAMHYIVRKFNGDTGSELKALLQAMYTYHLTAEDYIAAAYKPTSLTVSLYEPQDSVYGFTFNTMKKPPNTVLQIRKDGTEEWTEYPVSSVSATTYNENDTVLNYYISKAEVPLEKDSSYIYRVYDKKAEVGTEYVTLTTNDPQTESFTFVHVSDSQEGATYFNRVLSQVADNAEFIVHTGDVVQNSKYEYEWTEMLDGNFEYLSRIPVMAISGNHETTYNTRGIAETFKHFNNAIPAQASTNLGYFYSFIYGNVKFIMLNTNDLTGNKLKAEQYNWLVNELGTNTCKWTVVALHNPLYSAGRYGSDSSKNEIALALQQQLRGLFAQYGVDIVLQGHDHVISKTYPIDGNGIAQSETIENIGGVEYSVNPSGVIYLMNGPAGSQTRVPYVTNDTRYAYAEGSQAASWAELSFEGDILTVTVKYHDGTNEKVYHTWGIKKDASNTPALRISSVYPYADFAKAYLEAEDPNVSDYTCGSVNPNVDTVISWNSNSQATGYTVLLSTEKDYSNAKTYQVSAENCSVAVNNLLKAQTYYVKVTAEGTSVATEGSFTTTDLGPRVMTVDGVYNVRDMGGYLTASGKTTKQGLIYRGGALSPSADYPNVQITESGIATMAEEMGIRTEIDFRNSTEALGITESLIPDVELIYCTLGGYDSGMTDYAESYKKTFQLLAQPESYPVYYHCTGGADRTGTVSYLLGALLGMDETDLIHDYEFTSFSMYGERNSKTTKYAFGAMCALLETYEGATLADKAEQYLLSIGVTEDEIFNIRAIMFGEEPKELPEDGADTPETTVPSFFDYMNSKETITLNSSMTSVTSDLAVGYGKTVRIPLDTQIVSTGSGRLLVYIGSYGLNMRGNSLRFHINDGSDTEIKPRPDSTEYKIYNNFFDDGGYMDLTVTLTDTGVTFDIVAVKSSGTSQTFSYTYENVRVADEIASADAKITVKIDPTQVSEVILAP
ncbi:MAG: tyrosine-protein phosphatase [Oscillospiraceae bacterium]|nr:tyrosine-protein phosphatase [Oscillospiraceae bacterium]